MYFGVLCWRRFLVSVLASKWWSDWEHVMMVTIHSRNTKSDEGFTVNTLSSFFWKMDTINQGLTFVNSSIDACTEFLKANGIVIACLLALFYYSKEYGAFYNANRSLSKERTSYVRFQRFIAIHVLPLLGKSANQSLRLLFVMRCL